MIHVETHAYSLRRVSIALGPRGNAVTGKKIFDSVTRRTFEVKAASQLGFSVIKRGFEAELRASNQLRLWASLESVSTAWLKGISC